MLVLSRTNSLPVHIFLPDGRTVEVRVLYGSAGVVRLGFVAPRDINIVRDECVQRTMWGVVDMEEPK